MIRKMIVRQDIKKTILQRFLIGKKLIDMKKISWWYNLEKIIY